MRKIVVLLLVTLLLSSCAKKSEHKYTLYVFGTLVKFVIFDADKSVSDKAIAEISTCFQKIHRDWHAWKPGELSSLNKAISQGKTLNVSGQLAWPLEQAKRFEEMSGGLFNPTIGALVSLWGFHADERPKGAPPDKEQIRKLVAARPSMRNLVSKHSQTDEWQLAGDCSRLKTNIPVVKVPVLSHKISSTNPKVQLDFGGFAKGSALDWAAETLKHLGIKNAIINAGGDLNVIGRHGERPWKIGIKHPVNWGIIASLELGPDEVLYTSGNYYRYLEHEGVRYSHILDPRTGWPVDHIVSTSVIHKNGALADAAATALSVAGPDKWLETARNMGLTYVLLVDKNGGLYMTPKMQKRLAIKNPEAKIVEVKDPFATDVTDEWQQ